MLRFDEVMSGKLHGMMPSSLHSGSPVPLPTYILTQDQLLSDGLSEPNKVDRAWGGWNLGNSQKLPNDVGSCHMEAVVHSFRACIWICETTSLKFLTLDWSRHMKRTICVKEINDFVWHPSVFSASTVFTLLCSGVHNFLTSAQHTHTDPSFYNPHPKM